jgi:hypothetical protein
MCQCSFFDPFVQRRPLFLLRHIDATAGEFDHPSSGAVALKNNLRSHQRFLTPFRSPWAQSLNDSLRWDHTLGMLDLVNLPYARRRLSESSHFGQF